MKTPRQILEQEWYKKTDTPFTDQTADHLQYALDAMQIYAAQFSEGGEKSNSVLHNIIDGDLLLSRARQMQLEQQTKIDSFTEHYTDEIGVLIGIKRIVKLISRHCR